MPKLGDKQAAQAAVVNNDNKYNRGTNADESQFITHNHFKGAFTNIPHVSKRYRGGEDSYIFSSNLLGVADGVGGWNNKGVDPGIYSRELSSQIVQIFKEKRE